MSRAGTRRNGGSLGGFGSAGGRQISARCSHRCGVPGSLLCVPAGPSVGGVPEVALRNGPCDPPDCALSVAFRWGPNVPSGCRGPNGSGRLCVPHGCNLFAAVRDAAPNLGLENLKLCVTAPVGREEVNRWICGPRSHCTRESAGRLWPQQALPV